MPLNAERVAERTLQLPPPHTPATMAESKHSDTAAGAVVIGAGAAGQKVAKALVAAGVAPVTMIYPHAYSE